MPPGRRGRRGGFAGSGLGRGAAGLLGKRKGPDGVIEEDD